MRKFYTLVLTVFAAASISAQTWTTDFEDLQLTPHTYWDGSDASGQFQSGSGNPITFNNIYDTAFGGYWSGDWGYSNLMDDTTTGNQYSCYAHGGANGTSNYAIANAYSPVSFDFNGTNTTRISFYVTNTTYSAISMRDGDDFGKVFGDTLNEAGNVDGTNGEDWFILTVRLKDGSGNTIDSTDVYLADYRFPDDNQDYILDTWERVEFNGFYNGTHTVEFELSSSDVASWGGFFTPAFFSLDEITMDYLTHINELSVESLSFYPNPSNGRIQLNDAKGQLQVFDLTGALVYSEVLNNNQETIDLSFLTKGIYQLTVSNQGEVKTAKLIKQ